jgi:tRNA dimethylallyltransferase
MESYPLLIILGPTASGKTRLAVQLADALGGEIISADSRQIFQGMDIGTGKDLGEYQLEGRSITHHLIDIREAGEKYDVDSFKKDFYAAFREIQEKGHLPILCGGTGMYVNSLLQSHSLTSVPVNPELRARLLDLELTGLRAMLDRFPPELTRHADKSTVKRLIRAIEIATYLQAGGTLEQEPFAFTPYVVGLNLEVASRRNRIAQRLEARFASGLIEEVQHLLESGVSADILTFYGLEYKMVVSFLNQEINLSELKERLYNGICQYAKRQMTFFRKMEKDGVEIHWYQADTPIAELTKNILNDLPSGFMRDAKASNL